MKIDQAWFDTAKKTLNNAKNNLIEADENFHDAIKEVGLAVPKAHKDYKFLACKVSVVSRTLENLFEMLDDLFEDINDEEPTE